MIWVVLGWVLIGLFILAIELGWLAVAGTWLKSDDPSQHDAGGWAMVVWVIAHVGGLLVGGVLLVQHGLAQ